MVTTATRLAFIDDHPALLSGLATIFDADPRYQIAGTGASADDALSIGLRGEVDVMILDLSMPGDVFAAMDQMVRNVPALKLIVFTAFSSVELALRALDAGAHAFVLKGRPADDLYEAIDAVLLGDIFVSPDFSDRVMAGFRNRVPREQSPPLKLSAREQQLVDCLLRGQSNKEIARTLDLAEKTIKHYMTNLMNKLRVKSRVEVVLAAQRMQRELGPELSGPE